MASKAQLDIIVSLVDEASDDLKRIKNELKDTEKGSATASTSFKDFGIAMTKVGGMAVVAGVAIKKAFDFTEAGAGVLQLRESFAGLGVDFEALQDAAGGTIDEMTLMSSTAKLLAGTSGDLNAEMAAAAPRLIELARAAVKLDPTIGTVAQTYQSLATGIKKNQPLLIDNANIMVKVGTANENMANSLGKTVGELTEEEKAMALLNETLRAGDKLIEQVGGSVDSQTDSWSRLRASVKDSTDQMKASAAEGLEPVIRLTADYIDKAKELQDLEFDEGFTEVSKWQNLAKAQEELQAVNTHAIASGIEAMSLGFMDVGASAPPAAIATNEAAISVEQYNAAIAEQDSEAMAALVAHNWEESEAAAAAASATLELAASFSELSQAQFAKMSIDSLAEAMRAAGATETEVTAATRDLMIEFGFLTAAEENATGTLGNLTQQFIDGKITAGQFKDGVDALKRSVDGLQDKTITITANVKYNDPGFGGPGLVTPGKGEGGVAFSSGGVSGGGYAMVGEQGPERVYLPQGAQVSPAPVTNNYFNTTVSTRATTGTYTQDMAQAQARMRGRR